MRAGAEQEAVVRALTRWTLRRPRFWRVQLLAYPLLLVVIVGGLSTLDLMTGETLWQVLRGLPLLTVGALILLTGFAGLEVTGRGLYLRRIVRRMVRAQTVADATATVTITADEITAAYPTFLHRVPTATVVGGAWVDDVLVLETHLARVHALPHELIGHDGWALLAPVLGSRVRGAP